MSDEARIEAAAAAIMVAERMADYAVGDSRDVYMSMARAALAAADAAGETVTVSRDDLRALMTAWQQEGRLPEAIYDRLRVIVQANT